MEVGSQKDLLPIINRLRKGQVGVIPTDTLYGLSSCLNRPDAVNRIYTIKGRKRNKPCLILVSDLEMAKRYTRINSGQEKFIRHCCNFQSPPTTFILPAKKKGAPALALRLPKNVFLIKMIRSLDQAIISTSCNRSGQASLNNLKEIASLFKIEKEAPDFLLKFKNFRPGRKASRILDLRDWPLIKKIRI